MYLKYLKSLLIHKWFVFLAGLKTGVPIWRLIVHDWSKFLPVEFISYARHFFGNYPDESEKAALYAALPAWSGKTKQQIKHDFDNGWLHHQNLNPHHWQYWILVYDDDPKNMESLPMPETYVREMVADWMGASRAYTGSWDMSEWLTKNEPRIASLIHEKTHERLCGVLHELDYIWLDGIHWVQR